MFAFSLGPLDLEELEALEKQMAPAVSEKQRKMMGADLARKRTGKKTKTGMTKKQLEEFAKKK